MGIAWDGLDDADIVHVKTSAQLRRTHVLHHAVMRACQVACYRYSRIPCSRLKEKNVDFELTAKAIQAPDIECYTATSSAERSTPHVVSDPAIHITF